MPSGYEALQSGAGWIDLSARGRISVTGEDRARLLHALVTNHVQQLKPGESCYAFFLDAQGHIQADVNLLCLEDRILLDTEPGTREWVLRHLDKYIIADDVALEDVTESLACLGVEGPQADEILPALGEVLSERATETGAPGFRIFVPAAEKAHWIARLDSAGAIAATPEEARTVRLENAKPRFGEDIFSTTLPQETQQMHAIHFAKGCYLGQEIVERIRSRGHVNRLLVGFQLDGPGPPPAGTRIKSGDVEVGEITSAAWSPKLGNVAALGYVRSQYAAASPLNI